MRGHGADKVKGKMWSESANQQCWKSLEQCYQGHHLVVVKQSGTDCCHISASLEVTLEVNLMSQTNFLGNECLCRGKQLEVE